MATEAAPEKPKKRKKLLIIISVIVVLLLLIGGGALYFILRQQQAFSDDETPAEKPQKKAKKSDSDAKPTIFTAPEMFTANLSDFDTDRFVQIGIVFEITDPKAEEKLKAVMPVIRSRILLLVSAKNANELHTPDGKKLLASQVLEIARQEVGDDFSDDIKASHFSNFVIQ